jgi:hypothetical protein
MTPGPAGLQSYLQGHIKVMLSGRQKKLSRRKAYFLKHALQAAKGDFASLELLMSIAKTDGEGLPTIVARPWRMEDTKRE